MTFISLSYLQFWALDLLPIELIFLALVALAQFAAQITGGWTQAVNCSQSSSIATAQCLAEFHSISIPSALLALPSLWPLIIKCFSLQWPNPSCFLCLPTKYPYSIHNSLSTSQTNSWAIGTHCSVAFHSAFSLTELQILKCSPSCHDRTSFWHLWSVLETFKNE